MVYRHQAGLLDAKQKMDLLQNDVKAIEEADADGKETGAAGQFQDKIEVAPEGKALKILPKLFLRTTKPTPQVPMNELQSLTKVKDVEAFQKRIGATLKHSPLRRGAG